MPNMAFGAFLMWRLAKSRIINERIPDAIRIQSPMLLILTRVRDKSPFSPVRSATCSGQPRASTHKTEMLLKLLAK